MSMYTLTYCINITYLDIFSILYKYFISQKYIIIMYLL